MALTPAQQARLDSLDAQFGAQTPVAAPTGLSPAQQARLDSLESEFGAPVKQEPKLTFGQSEDLHNLELEFGDLSGQEQLDLIE